METMMFSPIGLLVLVIALVWILINPVNKTKFRIPTKTKGNLKNYNLLIHIRPPP
jgi:hypothetical protein